MFYNFFAERNKQKKLSAIGSWNIDRRLSKQLKIMEDTGPLKGICLEIGPGEGIFADKCREVGLQYQAIERSPVFQQRLVDRGFDVELGSAPPVAYEDAQFDFVCILAVLEHMPTFEQGQHLLQECHRVLKPGGRLVVSIPDFIRGGIDFFAWDYTHSFIMTPLRAQQILGDNEFQILRTQSFTGALHAPLMRFPIDLCGFLIHSRLFYWLADFFGLQFLPFKFHKTFQPSIFVVAKKAG